MKFRLISKHGDGLSMMEILSSEGFNVDVWVKDPVETNLPKALSWTKSLAKDTVILFDYHGAGKIADTLRSNGYFIYGASVLNDHIEGDLGRRLAKSAGIKIPKLETFDTFNEALEHQNEGLVFQPQKEGEKHFSLKENVAGLELSVEKFYIGGKSVSNTLNSKLGSNGNVAVRFWKKAAPKIFKMTLMKIEPFLMKFNYSGPLTCKVIINKDGLYLSEWQARFSDGMTAFCEALNKKLGKLIIEILMRKPNETKPDYQWHCSNGKARCLDIKSQANILSDMMPRIRQLERWRYL